VDAVFSSLEHKRFWFKENVKRVRTEWLYHPSENNEWSYAALIEHLVIVEREILNSRDLGPANHSIKERLAFFFIGLIMSLGIKVPVQTKTLEPTGKKTLEALFDEWAEIRPKLFEFLSHDSNEAIIDHPILGLCNRKETLWFLEKHLKYHKVRAKKVFQLS
jgi:hypothetical protein